MRLLQKTAAGAAVLAAVLMLGGCQTASRAWDAASKWTPTFLHPYRPDVHQGNLVTAEMAGQLEKGLTRDQVQSLLGIPLLQDRFHQDRWDDVYYLNRRSGETHVRKLTVYFDKNGRVERWESDPMPDETTADLQILGDKMPKKQEKKAEASPKASEPAASSEETKK